MQRPVFLELS